MPIRAERPYAVLMLSPIILVVYALAVARLTRMITADKILERPRVAVVKWAWVRANPWIKKEPAEDRRKNLALAMSADADHPPMLAYFAFCPWCVSIWVGASAAPLVWLWGARPWLLVPALALALSYVTGFLASHEG
jgi:hypothetical protein